MPTEQAWKDRLAHLEQLSLATDIDIIMQALWEKSPAIMCILDPGITHYTNVNPAFCLALGRSEEEICRESIYKFIHPKDIKKSQSVVEQLCKI